MKKFLIIAQAIHPHMAPRSHRATELAKELVRQGHAVTLCAVLGKYDYTSFTKETGIRVHDLGISKFEWINSDIEQRSVSLWRKGIIFFTRRWLEFPNILLGKRVAKYLKACDAYDRIITVAVPYPIHWGTAYAKRHYPHLKNATWVSDCGDPFMGNPFSRPPFYFKWIEKWWCKTTDYITIPTEQAIDGYYPEFHNKIRIIPQGFMFDDTLLATYHKNAVPTFAYSGMVYPQKRDPRPFLSYLSRRQEDFRFIVYTNKPALFSTYKTELGKRLELREYIPREQLLHELSKMDFLVNIRNESGVQAPSKLIDYYLTKRPILEITSKFRETEVFEEFCRQNYSKQLCIENPERFNIVNVAKEFASL